jgi:hypothetical protein
VVRITASGAWLSGTVRYMASTPVSMSRLPQAAGVTPLTEMQTGVGAQSSPARSSLTKATSPWVLAAVSPTKTPPRVTR